MSRSNPRVLATLERAGGFASAQEVYQLMHRSGESIGLTTVYRSLQSLPEEIAIRFKHRLVSIHCFPNGNGRHSRIMADLIALHVFGLNKFSWGNSSLVDSSEQRKMYLNALKFAYNGDFSQLIKFARS